MHFMFVLSVVAVVVVALSDATPLPQGIEHGSLAGPSGRFHRTRNAASPPADLSRPIVYLPEFVPVSEPPQERTSPRPRPSPITTTSTAATTTVAGQSPPPTMAPPRPPVPIVLITGAQGIPDQGLPILTALLGGVPIPEQPLSGVQAQGLSLPRAPAPGLPVVNLVPARLSAAPAPRAPAGAPQPVGQTRATPAPRAPAGQQRATPTPRAAPQPGQQTAAAPVPAASVQGPASPAARDARIFVVG